jgi:hypothetical protein
MRFIPVLERVGRRLALPRRARALRRTYASKGSLPAPLRPPILLDVGCLLADALELVLELDHVAGDR